MKAINFLKLLNEGDSPLPNAIIVDLDGTLSDDTARSHYVTDGKRDFNTYHFLASEDPRHEFCYQIVNRFIVDTRVIFLTGRPESTRQATVNWLKDRCGFVTGYDLIMRPDGVYIKNHIFKQNIYNTQIKGRYNILFAIDDLEEVCNMWQENGVMALNCFTRD